MGTQRKSLVMWTWTVVWTSPIHLHQTWTSSWCDSPPDPLQVWWMLDLGCPCYRPQKQIPWEKPISWANCSRYLLVNVYRIPDRWFSTASPVNEEFIAHENVQTPLGWWLPPFNCEVGAPPLKCRISCAHLAPFWYVVKSVRRMSLLLMPLFSLVFHSSPQLNEDVLSDLHQAISEHCSYLQEHCFRTTKMKF